VSPGIAGIAHPKLAHLVGALAMLTLTSIRVSADTPDRPAIAFNRWAEDWSVLADPDVPRESHWMSSSTSRCLMLTLTRTYRLEPIFGSALRSMT
jgi:hypothetical protein